MVLAIPTACLMHGSYLVILNLKNVNFLREAQTFAYMPYVHPLKLGTEGSVHNFCYLRKHTGII